MNRLLRDRFLVVVNIFPADLETNIGIFLSGTTECAAFGSQDAERVQRVNLSPVRHGDI